MIEEHFIDSTKDSIMDNIVCRFFNALDCNRSRNCSFPHIISKYWKAENICRYHYFGNCAFGSQCWFNYCMHIGSFASPSSRIHESISQADEETLLSANSEERGKKHFNLFTQSGYDDVNEIRRLSDSLREITQMSNDNVHAANTTGIKSFSEDSSLTTYSSYTRNTPGIKRFPEASSIPIDCAYEVNTAQVGSYPGASLLSRNSCQTADIWPDNYNEILPLPIGFARESGIGDIRVPSPSVYFNNEWMYCGDQNIPIKRPYNSYMAPQVVPLECFATFPNICNVQGFFQNDEGAQSNISTFPENSAELGQNCSFLQNDSVHKVTPSGPVQNYHGNSPDDIPSFFEHGNDYLDSNTERRLSNSNFEGKGDKNFKETQDSESLSFVCKNKSNQFNFKFSSHYVSKEYNHGLNVVDNVFDKSARSKCTEVLNNRKNRNDLYKKKSKRLAKSENLSRSRNKMDAVTKETQYETTFEKLRGKNLKSRLCNKRRQLKYPFKLVRKSSKPELAQLFLKKQQQKRRRVCLLCFKNVFENDEVNPKFGILEKCNHTYCLSCIYGWRSEQNRYMNSETLSVSCPECCTLSKFIIPSRIFVSTGTERLKLIKDYLLKISRIHCKHFRGGVGYCRYGKDCLHLHVDQKTKNVL